MSSSKSSLSDIRAYWTGQAATHGPSPKGSWSDVMAMELEFRAMSARLGHGLRVLDVGCAAGHATLRYAQAFRSDFIGVDYIPEMVAAARTNLAARRDALTGTAAFLEGDILALPFEDERFDVVMAARVIINLHDWETQRLGLAQCARVLAPGGVLLLSESTRQGLENLNRFRTEWGLPPLPVKDFNRHLDQDEVRSADLPGLTLLEIEDFSSSYHVATRVLKPLLARIPGVGVDPANPDTEFNRFAASLPPCGDYGVQRLFVFAKS